MSNFHQKLKELEKTFQVTKTNSSYLFYGSCALLGLLGFSGTISEGAVLNIGATSGFIAITMIMFQVSVDIKYLEKRIENIESEIRDINEQQGE